MEELTIIIPVFNEQNCIDKIICCTEELLEKSDIKLEIVFINDGSTDGSKTKLENICNPAYKIYHHEINRGYGSALKTGIRNASSQNICIIDADLTYPFDEITKLANLLEEGYSMVVGSRNGEVAKIPILRRFPKWVLNKLANYLSGYNIPDLNSGLRVMKKKDVDKFIHILPDGFSFTTTITLAMLTNNMQVHYKPINYYQREGISKIRPVYDVLNFIQLILRTILYFNPLKIFIPLSFLLVILAIIVLIGSWFFFGKIMDMSFGVILMTAVMVIVIGMLADLIDRRLK